MIRQVLFPIPKEVRAHLRHRRDPSRLESFSDGVFGLAVTLLVASQGVPSTFGFLLELSQQVVPALICFGVLFGYWFVHCRFFRLFPLEDTTITWLNGLFLFVLLVGIYPLKFMIFFTGQVFSGQSHPVKNAQGFTDFAAVTHSQIPIMIQLYIGFFLATSTVLSLMHAHAYRQRQNLDLNPVEAAEAKANFLNYGFLSLVLTLSCGLGSRLFTDRAYTFCWLGVMLVGLLLMSQFVLRLRVAALQAMKKTESPV